MALPLRQAGAGRELLLPEASAAEAALVDGLVVRQASHLLDVVAALQPDGDGLPRATALARERQSGLPDLADIKGQAAPKRALEIAAAGGHSLLMAGPPGTGKSMLAQRLAGLLPPLDDEAALESAAVLSLAGQFDISRWGQRPMRSIMPTIVCHVELVSFSRRDVPPCWPQERRAMRRPRSTGRRCLQRYLVCASGAFSSCAITSSACRSRGTVVTRQQRASAIKPISTRPERARMAGWSRLTLRLSALRVCVRMPDAHAARRNQPGCTGPGGRIMRWMASTSGTCLKRSTL
jgi:energy-coupling factor transporter ATP-binding protein EcfA2